MLNEVADELDYTINDLKRKIDDIYEKRNIIAHQANIDNVSGNLESIDKEYVENSIDFIKKLVNSIHNKLIRDI